MALDVRRLSPTELVRLVNSSPLGAVLDTSALQRQRNQAGLWIGDGQSIHLAKYVAWLVHELARPRPPMLSYEDKRRRAAERDRLRTLTGQDVAPVPDVADPERRRAATDSLRTFAEAYFPGVFTLAWSDDHLRVLTRMERCVIDGGLFAFAMPRGSGKTTLSRVAALWAVLTGRREYVCLIGGSQRRAVELLTSVRRTILSTEADDLRADWPEALYPLWMLRNNARRQIGQHLDGEPTYCTWAADKLGFPVVSGERLPQTLRDWGLTRSPCASAVIAVTSLDANMRGQQHTRMDGTIVRPSLVLLDDPQTRESARSPSQTHYRLDLIKADVLNMAGPGKRMAAFLGATVIYDGDLVDELLDPAKWPEWQGERTKLIYAWPTEEKLWDDYRRMREESFRAGHAGREATEFYAAHREQMDIGARVAWPERHHADELSAIQHAMNLRAQIGEEAFRAEYQNEPVAEQETEVQMLRPEQVAERFNGRKRGEVPLSCSKLTGFIDLHKQVLYWCVCAWQDDFTGFVIDYGTHPDQRRTYFTLANATRTLGRTYPGRGEDGAIQAGLEELVTRLLQTEWRRAGGAGLLRIERLLVDMGYKASLAAAVKHKAGGATMWLSKGLGIRAGGKPISMYRRQPGWTLGEYWYVPNVRGTREFPHIVVDVNSWKSLVHQALAVAPGDPGALTLWGTSATDHACFAEHVAGAEIYVPTSGHGRQVQEWRARPERLDNHWFDCLVGCAAAASFAGVRLPGGEAASLSKRKRYSQADLVRRQQA